MCNYSDPWLPLPNPTPSSTVCVTSPGARNFHTYTDTHTSLAVSMQHAAYSAVLLVPVRGLSGVKIIEACQQRDAESDFSCCHLVSYQSKNLNRPE